MRRRKQLKAQAHIEIESLVLPVHIGWTEKERRKPQLIEISAEVFFHSLPKACRTDELQNTSCYGEICEAIKVYCKSCKHKLLESLCYSLFRNIKKHVGSKNKVRVKVKKMKPPIKNLQSASFVCSD